MDSRYRIGRIEVDRSARIVSLDGQDLHVERIVFDLMDYLAGRAGEVVSHDTLLTEVWGRSIASDTVVAQGISKLRQLLARDLTLDRPIATIRGMGYRLDAPVIIGETRPAGPQPKVRLMAMAALLLAVAVILFLWNPSADSTSPRIAILAVENLTGDSRLDWVAAGGSALMGQSLSRRGVEVVSGRQIEQLHALVEPGVDITDLLASLTGIEHVIAPRLVAVDDGFRMELVSLAGSIPDGLVLSGSDPASLTLAGARLIAERVRAPLPDPGGAGGLDNPFLNEAYARAFHHQQRGELQAAIELYDYILHEAPDYHWARYQLAISWQNQGEFERARELLDGLLEIALDDVWLAAAVRSTSGNLAWYAGDLVGAEKRYREALEHFEKAGMTGAAAGVRGNLGMVAMSQADYETGDKHYAQALATYSVQRNRIREAQALHNLGNSFKDRGDSEAALARLQRAYEIRTGLGLKSQAANTLSVIGEIAVDAGRIEEGVALLEQSLAMFTEAGNARGQAMVRADLATAQWRRGNLEEARELALDALTQARIRNEPTVIAHNALLLGRIERARGEYALVGAYLGEAEAIYLQQENPQGQLVVLAEQIRLAIAEGDIDTARELLARQQSLAVEFADARFIRLSLLLDARIRILDGDLGGIEPILGGLFADLDENVLERGELAAELGESVRQADAEHALLDSLLPITRQWASRFYPAARLSWLLANSPADCEHAERALRSLRGEAWSDGLPDSEACTGPEQGYL